MSKTITIACQGAGELSLTALNPFQGELKTLSKDDYERLKHEILEDGFSFPMAVWQDELINKMYILDGHQRYTTLVRMRDEEGYSIPQIPVVFVEASSAEQAKHKLLAAASQYGKVGEEGLMAFLKDVNFNAEDLISSFRFPEIDLQQFVAHQLSISQPDPLDIGQVVIGSENPSLPVIESQQTIESATNPNQIRMVQLFLDGKTQPEFLQKIAVLQKKFETKNLTETVLQVIREAYSSLQPS